MEPILALLERRKNRVIRVILGTKERFFDDEDDGAVRKAVLDEVNGFFEEVREIIETIHSDRDVIVNQIFLDKLDELQNEIQDLKRAS